MRVLEERGKRNIARDHKNNVFSFRTFRTSISLYTMTKVNYNILFNVTPEI
jgi:hypothetical protein